MQKVLGTEWNTTAHAATTQDDDSLRSWIREQARKWVRLRAGAPALGTSSQVAVQGQPPVIKLRVSPGMWTHSGRRFVAQGEATGSVEIKSGGTVLLGRWQRGRDEWVLEEVSRAVERASWAGKGQLRAGERAGWPSMSQEKQPGAEGSRE